MRALHALTNGDVGTALARNPLSVVMLGVLAGVFLGWASRRWRGVEQTAMAPAWSLWALVWGICAFWVLRNVPGWTWLSPA